MGEFLSIWSRASARRQSDLGSVETADV